MSFIVHYESGRRGAAEWLDFDNFAFSKIAAVDQMANITAHSAAGDEKTIFALDGSARKCYEFVYFPSSIASEQSDETVHDTEQGK